MDLHTALPYVLYFVVGTAMAYVYYMSKDFLKLRQLGIKGPIPWPVFGNLLAGLQEGIFVYYTRMYERYTGEKVFGVCEPGRIVIVVRDLDMIQDIFVKRFNSFTDRRTLTTKGLFGKTVLSLKGDHWRHVRNRLTPSFSSNKIRRMAVNIDHTTRQLLSNLRDARDAGSELELKHVLSCFTMDVIASSAFGAHINSLDGTNASFVTNGKKLAGFGGPAVMLHMMFPFLEPVFGAFGMDIVPNDAQTFFGKFADKMIESRRKDKTSGDRNDFLKMMIDAENADVNTGDTKAETELNENRKGLTHQEVQAQSLLFLLAGYETTSIALSFSMFILAHHPECCRRVQQELDEVLGQTFPTYDSVQNLVYLDMCINETLRMFPPVAITDRECTEDITLHGVQIPKGTLVWFSMYAVHHDPNIWQNPETFDPERFTPENKKSRHPYAFLPFGQGPRNCIGMRLALLEIKFALAAILQEMTPVPSSRSVYPVTLKKVTMMAVDGLYVRFVNREQA